MAFMTLDTNTGVEAIKINPDMMNMVQTTAAAGLEASIGAEMISESFGPQTDGGGAGIDIFAQL